MTAPDRPDASSSIPSLTDTDQSFGRSSMYNYRDFSSVDDEELEAETQGSAPASPPPCPEGGMQNSIRVQKFQVKLYAILAQKDFHEIITWMPHGRSWKVLKPHLFESHVMPLFFEYSNYHSFNRLVNAWSFRRITSGLDRGSYYHELFLRGRPTLQKYMRRLPKTHKKLPMKKDDEPDFYEMDKASPLPSLEETSPGPQMKQQQVLGSGSGVLSSQIGQMGLASGIGGMSAFEPRDPLLGMKLGQDSLLDMKMGQDSLLDMKMGQDSLLGMRMGQQTSFCGTTNMAMNDISSIGSMCGINMMSTMGSMNGVGSMHGLGSLNGMNHQMNGMNHQMNTVNQMNTMNQMSSLRGSSGFGSSGDCDLEFQRLRGGSNYDLNFQRLCHPGQPAMQLFDHQMNNAPTCNGNMGGLAGGEAPYTNVMMGRQQC